jgi:hypothetical protein
MSSARARAAGSSASSATTSDTSPTRRARSALMKRPLIMSSAATEVPTARGRK